MEILIAKNRQQSDMLVEVIDSITVMAEMVGQELFIKQSWLDLKFEIIDREYGCKLIFELKNLVNREFLTVHFHEWKNGKFGYPIVAQSNMITYKSGKYSKPITLFISKFAKGKENEG